MDPPDAYDLFLFLGAQDVGHLAGRAQPPAAGQRPEHPLTTGRLSGVHDWPGLGVRRGDRLLHHAHVLVMEGNSYRNPPTKGRKAS